MDEDYYDDSNDPSCQKHGGRWKSRFQQLMNILRSKIAKQDLFRMTTVVCTCKPDDNSYFSLPKRMQDKITKRPKGEIS